MEVCNIEECRDGSVNNHKVQYTYKTEDDDCNMCINHKINVTLLLQVLCLAAPYNGML